MMNERSVTIKNLPDVITPKDIADILGICYRNAIKVVRFGRIRHFKIGNTYHITKKDFVDWLYQSKNTTIDFE